MKIINIIKKLIPPVIACCVILLFWQYISGAGLIPAYMLPSPYEVALSCVNDSGILLYHSMTTLYEALSGLAAGIILSFIIAVLMDMIKPLKDALYPLLITSQTIPSIAIAPLLALWMGYHEEPKIVLVAITTFFPVTIGLLDGFDAADKDLLSLIKVMGAGRLKTYTYVKFPCACGYFFSGLKISVTYAMVSAVISEWIGGQAGLGVYMTRVRKSFDYDRMFAVIIYIALISLGLIVITNIIKRLCMPWERKAEIKE